ncbi:MAG: hypothetical protein ACWGNV_10070 [Bacteroidales bacterium]
MRKFAIILVCAVFIFPALGQEGTSNLVIRTTDKHQQVIWQYWSLFGVSIEFAKEQGVSPYEYGKNIGGMFAQTWNEENGFEGLVNSLASIFECFNTEEDGSVMLVEKSDGSVLLSLPIESRRKYFWGDLSFISLDDLNLCILGVLEQVAEHMGASVSQEITEDKIIYQFKRL